MFLCFLRGGPRSGKALLCLFVAVVVVRLAKFRQENPIDSGTRVSPHQPDEIKAIRGKERERGRGRERERKGKRERGRGRERERERDPSIGTPVALIPTDSKTEDGPEGVSPQTASKWLRRLLSVCSEFSMSAERPCCHIPPCRNPPSRR